MLAICAGARWKWVDKVVFAVTHGEMGEHNLCRVELQCDRCDNAVYKQSHESTDASEFNSALKCWDFIRKGLWTATCETKAGIGKFLWRIKGKHFRL